METYFVRFLLQRGVSVTMVHDTSDPLETYHIWIGPFSDSVDRLGFPHVHTSPDYHYTIHLHTHTRPLGTLSVGDESGFALSHGARTPLALDLNRNPAVDEHQPPPELVKPFPRDPNLSLQQSASASLRERERRALDSIRHPAVNEN